MISDTSHASAAAYERAKNQVANLRQLKTQDLKAWIDACEKYPAEVRSALLKNYNRSRDDLFLNRCKSVREDLTGISLPADLSSLIADLASSLELQPGITLHTLVERDNRLFATWSVTLATDVDAEELEEATGHYDGLTIKEHPRGREITGMGEVDPATKKLTIIPATKFYEPALVQVARLLAIAQGEGEPAWQGTPADGFSSEFDADLITAIDEQEKLVRGFLSQPVNLSDEDEAELDRLGDVIAIQSETASALRAEMEKLRSRLTSAEDKVNAARHKAFSIKTKFETGQVYYSTLSDEFYLAKIRAFKGGPPNLSFFVYDKSAQRFSDLIKITNQKDVAALMMQRVEGHLVEVDKDADLEAVRSTLSQPSPGP